MAVCSRVIAYIPQTLPCFRLYLVGRFGRLYCTAHRNAPSCGGSSFRWLHKICTWSTVLCCGGTLPIQKRTARQLA
ncbi:hypothetical protein BOTBODRAFT_587291 [Botryobasidium botryosum FD-172 SS1]|uniref:Uncharacterized protein n=1 Tax=Botryobasidium botryosum (strain FD-172 SS1) TaxID=930990 RepID=A0A067LZZ0_BOTB1|nr:hypothetical protein BOTBODRAFT_587291 [Botryobasidium botryosum FD-172 SS1]